MASQRLVRPPLAPAKGPHPPRRPSLSARRTCAATASMIHQANSALPRVIADNLDVLRGYHSSPYLAASHMICIGLAPWNNSP